MNGESLNIEQDNRAKLKEQFPNLFTEGKLDWEKLKATFSDDINFANERYVLNWAGKSDAFKVLQKSYYNKIKCIGKALTSCPPSQATSNSFSSTRHQIKQVQ